MHALVEELLDLLLPPVCAGCGASVAARKALCEACWRALHPISPDACLRCQARPARAGERCPGCLTSRDPLDACLAAVWFEGDASHWIHRFKYPKPGLAGLDAPARAVMSLLAERAAALVAPPDPDLLIPIPLHPHAVRRRGFNPAAVLAGAMARRRGVPLDPVGLIRTRDTPSQTGLSRVERRRNLAGAFQPRCRLPARIWLVDDVVTTGATLHAAARACRAAGARQVIAVCAARTPAPEQAQESKASVRPIAGGKRDLPDDNPGSPP